MSYKLSIITINLNNAEGFRRTIESVVSQTFTDFEYIVIDGGSTDSSIDVIKQYADKMTYWVSELDAGIYNAMNKGILQAQGEYCLFLNSGDWLADENVVLDFFDANLNEDIISGHIFFFDNGNAVLNKSIKKEDLNYGLFYDGSIFHPSTFIKRRLFLDTGLYNENFKIVSDWEFFFKALIINNCSYNYFDRVISYFDLTGISNQQKWKFLEQNEREEVLKSFLPLVYKSYNNIYNENIILRLSNQEYANLRNGKLSTIIKLLLWLKKKLCKTL